MKPPTDWKQRFWDKVEKREDGCWVWTGCRRGGYGLFLGERRDSAHRIAYTLLVGDIPDGLTLDHLCRNRACVNPTHLEPVTLRQNILRGTGPTAINARKTHCKRGHPLSGANLFVKRTGGRQCLICKRAQRRGMEPPVAGCDGKEQT